MTLRTSQSHGTGTILASSSEPTPQVAARPPERNLERVRILGTGNSSRCFTPSKRIPPQKTLVAENCCTWCFLKKVLKGDPLYLFVGHKSQRLRTPWKWKESRQDDLPIRHHLHIQHVPQCCVGYPNMRWSEIPCLVYLPLLPKEEVV